MYHKVYIDSPTIWWVTVNDFYRQMFELRNKEVVYLDDYNPLNPNQVVITFDGIYKNILTFAAPIMQQYGYPFELFISSDYIGKNNEFDKVEPRADFTTIEELQELEKMGGRIQWHTCSHPDMSLLEDIDIITKELIVPAELKQQFSNHAFKWFAYPYGRFNKLVIEETKKHFSGAVSCVDGNDFDSYCFNRITVLNETRFSDKKLSCIIASYNYGAYLSEAIESVMGQTIPADEILIIDDASEDNTQEVGEFYANSYPNLIRYHRNEKNLGVVDNFNKAVSLTKGDYIVFLGADNRFLSNYFEECLKVLGKSKDIAIAYTDYALFGSRARLIYNESYDEAYKGKILEEYYYIINFPVFANLSQALEEMKLRNFIHGSSMYKREAFVKVGGYKKNFGDAEDFNLFKRIIQNGYNIGKAQNTFLEYRQHSKNQSNIRVGIEAKLNFYIKKTRNLEAKNKALEKKLLAYNSKFPYKQLSRIAKIKSYYITTHEYIKKKGLRYTANVIFKKIFSFLN